MTTAPPLPRLPGDPADDVRVARIHLRMGQLTLARAELEDLLGRDALDTTGLAVLAEARWRTGDGEAATAAAEAHLEAGGIDAIAVCIAAEAAAADGRPGDARVLMDRLPTADAATLDALFAGMPRRAYWPAGPIDRSELDEIRREAEARGTGLRGGAASRGPSDAAAGESGAVAEDGRPAFGSPIVPGPREVLEASGAWDAVAAQIAAGPPRDRQSRTGVGSGRRAKAQLNPTAEVEQAREELGTKPERALLRLSLVLRADPTLAPAILDAISLRREPAAALLRGDAERLLGRHLEAEAAFDVAAETLEP
jgi:hypothetical protein